MRRQTELGGPSAGSSRTARLDPFALPVRFAARDAAADEEVRQVELHAERVILRRSLQGMRITLNVPVATFLGVAIRIRPPQGAVPPSVAVMLEHRDPALSIELYSAPHSKDIIAEWQSWSRVLGVPLLVVANDGSLREPFPRIGRVLFRAPAPRRRSRSAVRGRRPRFLVRRRTGIKRNEALVHRDEREIVARS